MIMDVSGGCKSPKSYKMVHKDCGVPIEMITGCNKRFVSQCPVCSKRWAAKVRRRVYDAVVGMDNPSFLTLTLLKRHTGVSRMKTLWSLRRSLFQRLRYDGHKIGGWVAVVEFPNHLHICMDSAYIHQDKISKIWKSITGDSYIVDIRRIGRGSRATAPMIARYLAKYLSKSTGWPPLVISEMRSFHVMQSHGLIPVEKHKIKCPCCGKIGGFLLISDTDYNALSNSPIIPFQSVESGPPITA